MDAIAAARTLGPSADFVGMSEALRDGEHAEAFDALMRDILRLAENRRDLLGEGTEDAAGDAAVAAAAAHRALHAHELRDAIRRLRDAAIRDELQRITSAGAVSSDDAATYRRLIEEQSRLRQPDGPSPAA